MPVLSVLVPVRDARPWLAASFASLARQTVRDLEIVAVDDGSSDGSGEWLDRHRAREPRLRVIHTPPRGLPAALAVALDAARAPLIARHDADDLSHRERFERQLALLDARRDISVTGTRARLFPAGASGVGMRRWVAWNAALLEHDAMRHESLIDSVLIHGTLLARRRALERAGGWTERGWPEDVDLWRRLFATGARFAKLPRVLYAWRQHPGSATRTDPRYRVEAFDALRQAALTEWRPASTGRWTLIGVGRALERWRARIHAIARGSRVSEIGRPDRAVLTQLQGPLVLVFGAAPARARWRAALRAHGYVEGRDFIFVA